MSEAKHRRRNILWIGVVLLVGFVAPVWGPKADGSIGCVVPNIKELQSELYVSGLSRFLLTYPLMACAALFALALWAKPLMRGIGLVALGVLPWLFVREWFGLYGGAWVMREFVRDVPATSQGVVIFWLLALVAMGSLMWAGLFIGSRTRGYRPSSQAAHVFGVAGAALFIAFCIMALFFFMGILEDYEAHFSKVGGPYSGFFVPLVLRCGLVAASAPLMAATVLCLTNSVRSDDRTARRKARTAFWLLLTSSVIVAATLVAAIGSRAFGGKTGADIAGVTMVVKTMLIIVPIGLLVPFGLSDLIVGNGEPVAETPRGA